MSEINDPSSCDLHNLKSTLTAVMGYIQMAQKNLSQNFDAVQIVKVNELLNKAIEAANKLEEKITTIETGSSKSLDEVN